MDPKSYWSNELFTFIKVHLFFATTRRVSRESRLVLELILSFRRLQKIEQNVKEQA